MTDFNVTLAHKRSSKLDVSEGAYIQPKLDGVRCYTRLIDGQIRMFSRNHKEFHNCEHIKQELKELFNKYPDTILDGELYNHDLKDDFNKIISLVRKQKPTEMDRIASKGLMQYHVYDTFDPNFKELGYVIRKQWLNAMIDDSGSVRSVVTIYVSSQFDVDAHEQSFLDMGYEGAMLRKDVAYEQKRSHNLQKVKRFKDDEATVIDAVEGKGKLTGKLGKFMMQAPDGRVFGAPASAFTHEERTAMWANRARYINTIWTYEYFELTPAGMPRFPVLKGQRNYE